MTLIKDLIQIPERVQRGDFVLNLASGLEVEAIEQTFKDSVVNRFEDDLSIAPEAIDAKHEYADQP